MKEWSNAWKASKQPRKQRKYRARAPLHIKQKFLGAHLSKELRQKYKKRSMPVKVGDKVRIMTGQFRGVAGKVEKVSVKLTRVYVAGAQVTKRDGTKVFRPLHPSNIMLTDLVLEDKRRTEKLKVKS